MDSKVYQRKPVYQFNETVKQSAYTMRSDRPLGLVSVKKRQVVSIVDLLIKGTVLKDGARHGIMIFNTLPVLPVRSNFCCFDKPPRDYLLRSDDQCMHRDASGDL